MALQYNAVLESDLRNVRELLGLTGTDFSYLIGGAPLGIKVTPNKGVKKRIKDPRLCILLRLLRKYPDGRYFPMPVMPTYNQVYDSMEKNWIDENNRFNITLEELSRGIFGPLFGVNFSAGYNWSKGGNYDAIVSRLFWVVHNMITQEGQAGLIKYLEVVDEEAKSRNVKMGIRGILKERGWATLDNVEVKA
jgi:hypothetical protein